MSSPGHCDGSVDGVHEDCCLHDLRPGHKHFPGQICCWCGDLFLPRTDSKDHGMYEPGISSIDRKLRAVVAQKEEWIKEQERKKFREDYGTEPYF